MNGLLILDTNAVSAITKGRAESLNTILTETPYCISVITEAELRFGLARRPVNADLRRIVENFLASVDILPWTSACAAQYGFLCTELELRGKTLAPMDLLIAAQAVAAGCPLVSADRAFTQVPGLQVFDWSAPANGN
ncbi:MAG: type II toxin-antitoxin system VapC family toxin [Sulfuricella sp.]|nr:type II toxin-antitoxin system VapC family toxin [Sulfuricella sp.]